MTKINEIDLETMAEKIIEALEDYVDDKNIEVDECVEYLFTAINNQLS